MKFHRVISDMHRFIIIEMCILILILILVHFWPFSPANDVWLLQKQKSGSVVNSIMNLVRPTNTVCSFPPQIEVNTHFIIHTCTWLKIQTMKKPIKV